MWICSSPYDSHDIDKDIMTYFDKFIHAYGWNLSISWSLLKLWTSKNFTIVNFGHPVFKSWLRPWLWFLSLIHGHIHQIYLTTATSNRWQETKSAFWADFLVIIWRVMELEWACLVDFQYSCIGKSPNLEKISPKNPMDTFRQWRGI